MERTKGIISSEEKKMKNEVFIEDITDSKEAMLKKMPLASTAFIWIMIIGFLCMLIWACLGKIDIYINAYGEIRPNENASTITLKSGGKLEKINVQEGQNVEKGDILFKLDCEYLNSQKEVLEQQIDEKNKEIVCYQNLYTSIQYDENLMDKETEAKYYYMYQNYLIETNSISRQITKENENIYTEKQKIYQELNQIMESEEKAISLYNEYNNFYNIISNDGVYEGDNRTIQGIYESYVISQNKVKSSYESYASIYEKLIEQSKTDPLSVTQSQLEQALLDQNTAYDDIAATKINLLIEINEIITEIENQIEISRNNSDNSVLQDELLDYRKMDDSEVEKIKNVFYIDISDSISSIEREIDVIEKQVMELEENIKQSDIIAERKGVFVCEKEYAEGDIVTSNITLGTIVSDDEYSIEIYIPEYAISEVKEKQKVEYVFEAIPKTDFGRIYGKIQHISADSFTNPSTGLKYYRAKGSIDKVDLKSNEGEIRRLEIGMQAEVHAITGEQSILSWAMEKLNL